MASLNPICCLRRLLRYHVTGVLDAVSMRLCLDFHSFVNKQNEIETLKAENDRLKSSGNATPTATPIKTARPPSETSSTSSSSSRQSLGLSLNNLNITDTIMSGRFTVSSGVCVNQRQLTGESRKCGRGGSDRNRLEINTSHNPFPSQD